MNCDKKTSRSTNENAVQNGYFEPKNSGNILWSDNLHGIGSVFTALQCTRVREHGSSAQIPRRSVSRSSTPPVSRELGEGFRCGTLPAFTYEAGPVAEQPKQALSCEVREVITRKWPRAFFTTLTATTARTEPASGCVISPRVSGIQRFVNPWNYDSRCSADYREEAGA